MATAVSVEENRQLQSVGAKCRFVVVQNTRYDLIQNNGQRIYGPPPNWQGVRPVRGCEVYVGRLPRDAYEEELIPIFTRAGQIFELRLMMEFSGYTRGFCFVTFANKDMADTAIRTLHNFEIRRTICISVCRSLDSVQIYISGVPVDKTPLEILHALEKKVSGIVKVTTHTKPNEPNINRGNAIVEFKSHKVALEARKILWPTKVSLFGHQIYGDWRIPNDIDGANTTLFVSNLTPISDAPFLTRLVYDITGCTNTLVGVERWKSHAFMRFASKHAANTAFKQLKGMFLDSKQIYVNWSRSKTNHKGLHQSQILQDGVIESHAYSDSTQDGAETQNHNAPSVAPAHSSSSNASANLMHQSNLHKPKENTDNVSIPYQLFPWQMVKQNHAPQAQPGTSSNIGQVYVPPKPTCGNSFNLATNNVSNGVGLTPQPSFTEIRAPNVQPHTSCNFVHPNLPTSRNTFCNPSCCYSYYENVAEAIVNNFHT